MCIYSGKENLAFQSQFTKLSEFHLLVHDHRVQNIIDPAVQPAQEW